MAKNKNSKSIAVTTDNSIRMPGYFLQKDHVLFLAEHDMQEFCKELLKKYDLNGFRQVRLYDEGSRFELTTHASWTQHFMELGYFNYSRLDRNGTCYHSGYCLWDAWNKDTPAHEIVIRDAIVNYDGGRGFSILRRSQEWVDKFEFSTSTNNHKANEMFLSNIEALDRFVDEFLQKMAPWIKRAHQSRDFLPFAIDASEEYADTFLPAQILKAVSPTITPQQNSFENASLTKRELECIYWLSLGKTTPEIAMILNVSARTVEKFIIAIKEKFNCRTLFQMGQVISRIRLDCLLQGTRYR